jgi:hypothetical protein
MDAMQQKMQRQERRPIGEQLIDMEQKSMERVFQYRPDDVSNEETHHGLSDRIRRD